ncbi:MAG: TolC family protein [Desulfuromonadales bacterium]|nr:TolC family protein [Desulfuromonadales bacterium]
MNHVKKRIHILVIGLLFLITTPVLAAGSLDDLVESALLNNPELQAAKARWQMFGKKIDQAESFADPKLSFAFSSYPIDSLAGDETPMTGNDLRIDQAFPFPGKLAAKGAAARHQALWYKGVYEDTRLQLAGKIKSVWYQRYYVERAIDVTERTLLLLDDIARLTETRYAVGSGRQQDVLKAQLEQSRFLDRRYALQQQQASLAAELRRLIGTDEGDIDVPEQLAIQPVEIDAAELYTVALQQRPLFAAYRALIDSYGAKRRFASLDSYPDVNLWVGYRFRDEAPGDRVSGTDFVSTGVSINLPIYRKKRVAAVAEAEEGAAMARRQLTDFENSLRATVRDYQAQIEKNLTRIELYRSGIIPQAQQVIDVGLIAYQVGDLTFISLLDSLLTLDRYQLGLHRATADYLRTLAQLEATVGGNLDLSNNKEL